MKTERKTRKFIWPKINFQSDRVANRMLTKKNNYIFNAPHLKVLNQKISNKHEVNNEMA